MDDIAHAADMSRPALYLVFKNKKEIFQACMRSMLQGLKERFQAIGLEERALEERVDQIIHAGIIDASHDFRRFPLKAEIFGVKAER